MATGTLTTYDLTVGVQLDIEDLIHLLDPNDTPLTGLNAAGIDGRQALSRESIFEKKIEWLDEELLTPRSSVQDNPLATSATTLTVESGDGLNFGVGDVIALEDELVRVTATDPDNDQFTITRGFGGTTDVQHAQNVEAIGVGTALAEGSDPGDARAVDRSNRHNFTQIFGPHAIQVSGTENVVRKYGLAGTTEFDHQVRNRMWETAISIEQAVLYGQRFEDTSGKLRTMGGFDYYITTNEDSTTTDIGASALLTQLQAVYDAGGRVTDLTLGSTQKRKVSGFDSSLIQLDRGDNGRGQVVDFFTSDFGQVSIHLNRWVDTADLFGWSRDQVSLATLRPLVFEALSKTGDSMKGQIVCEKSMRFRRERHAFKFTALE